MLGKGMKTKSALSYFGSDSEVAGQLAELLNDCTHVTIPFCGGMSILPYLKARAVVANDLHGDVINFYKYVSGQHGIGYQEKLIERCCYTLSHPQEIEDAQAYLDSMFKIGTVDRAWAFWAMCWVGRKGKGGTKHQGGMPSIRRTGKGGTNATRIRAAANDLYEWAEQFERCEFESVCFRELLPKVADITECGVYMDPPWVGAGRNYKHPFTEQDHRDLAELAKRFNAATVVVRYGDAPLIRELYHGWNFIQSESRDQCNVTKGEVWIVNTQ